MLGKPEQFKTYLKMANDLDASEPVIALCCRMHYAEKMMSFKKQAGATSFTPEEEADLSAVLNKVAETKKTLGMNKEEIKDTLEEFCSRAFCAIDKEDRTAPKIGKEHARRFLSTAYFIELLRSYDGMTPKWEELSKLGDDHILY